MVAWVWKGCTIDHGWSCCNAVMCTAHPPAVATDNAHLVQKQCCMQLHHLVLR